MTIRVGLAGLGGMGAVHFKAYRRIEGAEVVAVCDPEPKKLAGDWSGAVGNIDAMSGGQADLSNVRRFSDYAEFLASGVDMVDLTVPTHLHADMAIQALEAGKHVFCEKPMARTSARAREMIAAAEAGRRMLMVGHVLRFWPEYLAMKEMIDSGVYGPVRTAVLTRLGATPAWSWQNWMPDAARSGSAALDLHIHDADTVLWYFGKPRWVSSVGTVEAGGGVAHLVTQYYYDDGPAVVAEGGWDLPPTFPFQMAARIGFESAALDFDILKKPTLTVYTAEGQEQPPVPADDGYRDELAYFVECVASGRKPSRVTPQDAAAAVALVEAEVESVRSGRPVEVHL